MKIMFFSSSSPASTSFQRANALRRLGHEVCLYDPYKQFSNFIDGRFSSSFHYKTGYRFMQKAIYKWINKLILKQNETNIVWVDSGELFGQKVVQSLKSLNAPVILFNHDDPTGKRDKLRFYSLKRALGEYDLVTAVRDETEKELLNCCKGKVLRIWRTYDEIAHNPHLKTKIDPQLVSDISFIGTWIRGEKRDIFLTKLIGKGLNIAIWGDRWQKSPNWHQLKKHWRGGAVSGEEYVKAIQGAKICLGMLSKGNRDLHTTRSMEIPYAGGLLCAERTREHLTLYKEGIEAVFWKDVDECSEKCIELLGDSKKMNSIRLAGMERVKQNKVGNEDVCRQILLAVH